MEPFTATISHDLTSLRGLRHSLASWLEVAGISAEAQKPIVLATHEAAANAIEHGDAEGTVLVTAEPTAGGGFTVIVHNDGCWKQVSEHDGRGRGLALMRELMSEVGIKTVTTVRMRTAV